MERADSVMILPEEFVYKRMAGKFIVQIKGTDDKNNRQ